MEGPRPGGSASLIIDSPLPGKYEFSAMLIPIMEQLSAKSWCARAKAPTAYQ